MAILRPRRRRRRRGNSPRRRPQELPGSPLVPARQLQRLERGVDVHVARLRDPARGGGCDGGVGTGHLPRPAPPVEDVPGGARADASGPVQVSRRRKLRDPVVDEDPAPGARVFHGDRAPRRSNLRLQPRAAPLGQPRDQRETVLHGPGRDVERDLPPVRPHASHRRRAVEIPRPERGRRPRHRDALALTNRARHAQRHRRQIRVIIPV